MATKIIITVIVGINVLICAGLVVWRLWRGRCGVAPDGKISGGYDPLSAGYDPVSAGYDPVYVPLGHIIRRAGKRKAADSRDLKAPIAERDALEGGAKAQRNEPRIGTNWHERRLTNDGATYYGGGRYR